MEVRVKDKGMSWEKSKAKAMDKAAAQYAQDHYIANGQILEVKHRGKPKAFRIRIEVEYYADES